MVKEVLIVAVSAAFVFAENADSLRAEIEKLTARLQEIEQKNAEISTDVPKETQEEPQLFEKDDKAHNESKVLRYSSDKKDISFQLTSNDTTISVIKVKTARSIGGEHTDTTFRTVVLGEIKKNGGWYEKNSIGLSGGAGIGLTVLDMRPAKKFLTNEENVNSELKNSHVSASLGKWGAAISNGGFGIGGFGNGVVAGGGGYRARTEFVSKSSDAIFITSVNLRYGGFALGNGWQKDKNVFSLISFIGGGTYNIGVKKKITEGVSEETKIYDGRFRGIIDGASSSFFAFDLQTNYVRSLMRWFHVGGEVSGLFAISRKGFDYDSGYFSFSPSVRLNFIFGWL